MLVGNGWVNEEQVTEAHNVQMDVGYADCTQVVPEPSALTFVLCGAAQRYMLLPLSFEESPSGGLGRITLAIVAPWDVEAIDLVQRVTRRHVESLLSSESGLQAALDQAYHASQGDAHTSAMADSIEMASLDSVDVAVSEDDDIDLGSTVRQSDQAPVIRFVNTLLSEAIRRRTSDIHIEPQKKSF